MDTSSPTQQIPPVSKRATACVECQKHKVRCVLLGRKPPCQRCSGKHLSCVFKKGPTYPLPSSENRRLLNALLDDLGVLHGAVNELRAAGDLPDLPALRSIAVLSELRGGDRTVREGDMMPVDISTELIDKHPEAPSRDETTATQPPIQSLYQITRLRSLRSQGLATAADNTATATRSQTDLISRKVINVDDAEMLVNRYLRKTDHYLYGIASEYKTLQEMRQASPLLLTAVLTVEALQSADSEQLFRLCYAEFRTLVADFLFSHTVTLEDLRGLCIACFWLSDISWSISSLAIRRAVEMELHKSFTAAVDSLKSQQALEQLDERSKRLVDSVRIWYLLYICDQHLAILYGRPYIMREDEGIQNWPLYLTVNRQPTDIRILSQVALLQILRSVSETFGQDSKRRVPILLKPQLDAFNQQIDQWVNHWLGLSQDHPTIGAYPSKAIMLHHRFSKLLVSSHVFRGLGRDPVQDPLPAEFQPLALVAINSAKSVLDLTVNDPDIVAAFAHIPHYYHTMIAFACSFLLKTATIYGKHISIDSGAVINSIAPVISLCLGVKCTAYHLAHWIGRGLQALLNKYIKSLPMETAPGHAAEVSFHMQQQQPQQQHSTPSSSSNVNMAFGNSSGVWETGAVSPYGDHILSSTLFETPLQPSQDSISEFQWDPSMSFASLEHMGLGLL
ncbi:Zn(II)2Cys6 transcription factor [Aspergillus nidulans FGSC A4]|uniref:Zn(II)2Cys6 transcription factor (Eurofung) n=1 Tax=Emericella nidulans (strain FGSC A4 / ATCC 38163 / CBS 112.46 / NRRL 194 / M139) TaxID=227321 RepID=C8VK03_EMENI|nr:hypothetical protein [Aspergillus nidulans FGSC A4]CBF84142.1 TPA: Putative Zn(II)2Cys6 transcription factor (Eurofung) [Aspergillus nidulans FGSC A4]